MIEGQDTQRSLNKTSKKILKELVELAQSDFSCLMVNFKEDELNLLLQATDFDTTKEHIDDQLNYFEEQLNKKNFLSTPSAKDGYSKQKIALERLFGWTHGDPDAINVLRLESTEGRPIDKNYYADIAKVVHDKVMQYICVPEHTVYLQEIENWARQVETQQNAPIAVPESQVYIPPVQAGGTNVQSAGSGQPARTTSPAPRSLL